MVIDSTKDVIIEIFGTDCVCDRQHLLYPNGGVTTNPIYTESGNAFNGFGNDLILNTNYETIMKSRMMSCRIKGINNKNRVFYLINSIRPLRNDKCYVNIEYDSWMNNRNNYYIGLDNTLFECNRFLQDYPFYEYSGKFKYLYDFQNISNYNQPYLLAIVHDETNQTEVVWVFTTSTSNGLIYAFRLFYNLMIENNIDTNSILSIYYSPFEIHGYWEQEYPAGFYHDVSGTDKMWFTSINDINELGYTITKQIEIVNTPYEKTVITDMNGSIVWQSVYKNVGIKQLYGRIYLSYDECVWNFIIIDTSEVSPNPNQKSPNNRFTIQCNAISYYSDYYQQYTNLIRKHNTDLRQAQLEKQLIDGIGDITASSLWHGTSSGAPNPQAKGVTSALPATSLYGLAGGLIGGSAQLLLNQYATSEYNKKLDVIENRQAKLQYDVLNANGICVSTFVYRDSLPYICKLRVDDETYNSMNTFNNHNLIKYNCRVSKDTVEDEIFDNSSFFIGYYVSGDFDFKGISIEDALQLNQRFKAGVTFVSWNNDTGGS